ATEYISDVIPLESVYSLIEVQTLTVCERIFSWIESRVERLTKGMQAMRGKGPVLLRISNELLRRLPRSKQEHVVFSGRILLFLSSVFPLGEKSGVNLR
ncbi:THO complex, subunit THOC1, partial [Leucosporidium creatinivorum]